MMARLVALMASMRPTVRRVTVTLATPASTSINTMQSAPATLSLSRTRRYHRCLGAPCARVDLLQAREFHRDRTIRPAAHVGHG